MATQQDGLMETIGRCIRVLAQYRCLAHPVLALPVVTRTQERIDLPMERTHMSKLNRHIAEVSSLPGKQDT